MDTARFDAFSRFFARRPNRRTVLTAAVSGVTGALIGSRSTRAAPCVPGRGCPPGQECVGGICVAGSATTAQAAYRGGPAHTGEQPGPGPSGDLSIAWTRALPPPESVYQPTSPSLVDGVLYVLRWDGLYALDPSDGSDRWTYAVDGQTGFEAAPLVDNGTVYFTGYDDVYAVNAESGELTWQSPLDGTGEGEVATAAADGVVYALLSNGDLLALDADSGDERWRFSAGEHTAPTVVDGVVYIGGATYESDLIYQFWALDAETGKVRWNVEAGGWTTAPPVVAGDTVYAVTSTGVLYALDTDGGDERWHYGEPADVDDTGMAPAVADDTVYLGTWDGQLTAIDAGSGDVRWQQDLGGPALYPVVVDDLIFAVAASDLVVLEAATGETQTTLTGIGETIEAGGLTLSEETITTSPLVVDGAVYVSLEAGVVAIGGSD